jgi:hypothetical protein
MSAQATALKTVEKLPAETAPDSTVPSPFSRQIRQKGSGFGGP